MVEANDTTTADEWSRLSPDERLTEPQEMLMPEDDGFPRETLLRVAHLLIGPSDSPRVDVDGGEFPLSAHMAGSRLQNAVTSEWEFTTYYAPEDYLAVELPNDDYFLTYKCGLGSGDRISYVHVSLH
jgi:hypothetical protein